MHTKTQYTYMYINNYNLQVHTYVLEHRFVATNNFIHVLLTCYLEYKQTSTYTTIHYCMLSKHYGRWPQHNTTAHHYIDTHTHIHTYTSFKSQYWNIQHCLHWTVHLDPILPTPDITTLHMLHCNTCHMFTILYFTHAVSNITKIQLQQALQHSSVTNTTTLMYKLYCAQMLQHLAATFSTFSHNTSILMTFSIQW